MNGSQFFLWLALIGCLGCREAALDTQCIALDDAHLVQFANTDLGSRLIREDTIEGFFEQIRVGDMALQMKQPAPSLDQRGQLLASYRTSLSDAVVGFSSSDIKRLQSILQPLFDTVEYRFPGFWPDTLQLVQIRPTHLGEGVYYTRNRAIMLPSSDVDAAKASDLGTILLHELFHLYSRRNREQRDQLYTLVGFERLDRPLRFPKKVASRLLLNPDAVAANWGLQLDSTLTLPLIYQDSMADPERTAYLRAFRSTYFELTDSGDFWQVRAPQKNWSTTAAFQAKTGGNTDYIIHPEEILADNFSLLFGRQLGPKRVITPAGRHILEQLDHYLQGHSN